MHTKVIVVCSKVAERGGEGIAQVPRQWGTIHSPSLVQPSLEGGSIRLITHISRGLNGNPSAAHRDLGIWQLASGKDHRRLAGIHRRVPLCSGVIVQVPLGGRTGPKHCVT